MRDRCLSASVSGNPAGWDRVRGGLSSSCRFQSKTHPRRTLAFRCVLCLCVVVRQVVSIHLRTVSEGRGYVARGCRGGLRGPTPCVNIWVTPPPSASSVASGALTCLSGWRLEEERIPRNSLTWIHSTILTPFRRLIHKKKCSSARHLDIWSAFSDWYFWVSLRSLFWLGGLDEAH